MYRMELALIIVMGVNDLHARFILIVFYQIIILAALYCRRKK